MSRAKKSGTKAMLVMQTTITVDGKVVSDRKSSYGVCQKCGCTDFDCSQCIAKTGKPCSWVDEKHLLCSACVSTAPKATAQVKSKPMPRPGLRMLRGGA